jgi:hypothetical protein
MGGLERLNIKDKTEIVNLRLGDVRIARLKSRTAVVAPCSDMQGLPSRLFDGFFSRSLQRMMRTLLEYPECESFRSYPANTG